ncbi:MULTISPECIES: XRE family transcriptional regulator [Streptomyces]|uniref:XRE family transcriptional regulator n=2 Tax=Streptomyces TaxID=1883 RepID=A0A646KLN2_STRJU|nr:MULTISPECIES: XRE family transcriptional regulator [Streptomyces]MQS39838.1 XRE family transcriptional regulator [Streptomyces katsurahamanus]MQT03222.1 XRE family transcriptional regulator [Streptomyces jumonjinensis]
MVSVADRSSGHGPTADLAERVQRLIELRTPAGSRRPSYDQIARSINDTAGRNVISGAYIWELATGKTTNPRIHHLEALAGWGGTDVRYFFDDAYASRVEPQLNLLWRLKASGVLNVALRAQGLSHSSREQVGTMVDHLRSLEGLKEPDDAPDLPAFD